MAMLNNQVVIRVNILINLGLTMRILGLTTLPECTIHIFITIMPSSTMMYLYSTILLLPL